MRVAAAVVFITVMVSAQAQDSLKLYELKEVVVTGEVEPQSIRTSVYNVRTIPMERLQSQGSTRLQDVLNTELNIRFSQDPAVGGSNLTMMGLPGQNVKVLIDGVPVIGRQGTGNEVNINQLNVSTVERIEIVEGPMAVVYGADALAGVINIITRKEVNDALAVSATIHEESAGNEYGFSKGLHNQAVSVSSGMGPFYLHGNLTHNRFMGWRGDSTGREREWHPKNQWMAGAVAGYQKEGLNVYYRNDYLYEKIYDPAAFSGNEAIDRNYITQRLMQQVQATNRFNERLSMNAALSHTLFESRVQSIAVDRQTGRETLASSALQNKSRFTGVTFRSMVQYVVTDRFTIQPGFDINTEEGRGSRLKDGENGIADYAAFISGDIRLGWISLRPGVRFIKNSVYDAPPVIPSLNAKVTLGERHDLRASYGRGFRAPSIRELYFDFFDASHAIEGNPNLKAELSHSFNLSWNAQLVQTDTWRVSGVLSGFYNDVENLIDYGLRPGSNFTTYINVNEFKTKGVMLNTSFQSGLVVFRLGGGYTGRYNTLNQTADELPSFTWSPELAASAMYQLSETLNVSLFYKYTGRMPVYEIDPSDNAITLAQIDGYHWADLTAQKAFGERIDLSAGIRNLFNVTRIRSTSGAPGMSHGSSGTIRPVGYGRSFFVSLTCRLSKS